MPIYAYRCTACGHARDMLQKMSDPALTVCPSCGQQAFAKQLTAAGFQLKGSGWYATDFRGTTAPAPSSAAEPATASGSAADSAKPAGDSSPAQAAPAASSGGCGSACACH